MLAVERALGSPVDLCSGGRSGVTEQCCGAGTAARSAVAQGELWYPEPAREPVCRRDADHGRQLSQQGRHLLSFLVKVCKSALLGRSTIAGSITCTSLTVD